MVTQSAVITELTERIARKVNPMRLILFGSWARGEPRPDSDIDLLIITPDGADEQAAWRSSMAAVQDLGAPVDIVVAARDHVRRRGRLVGSVLRPALEDGVVLYAAPEAHDGDVGQCEELSSMDVAEETRRWLSYAEEDLRTADTLLSAGPPSARNVAYLAQQAAEEALKAVYVFIQVQYPFTHNLDSLRDAIPAGWSVRTDHPSLADLTRWAVAARYPDAAQVPTEADARQAADTALAVLVSVRRDLRDRGLSLA